MLYINKYLKYKQKYLNLKKIIGGGIDTKYTKTGEQLTLNYKMDCVANEITYTILEEIGKGTSGIVYKIINNNDMNKKKYIFKKINYIPGKDNLKNPLYWECKASDKLEGILHHDMLVLF